jgi:glucose-1-phosphate cytidylyltransferase
MKVVILCGGKGMRMYPMTATTPKPLLDINGKPILQRVMEHFAAYGHTDFLLLTGYMSEKFEKFAKKIRTEKNWNVDCYNTGENTSKGDRLKLAYYNGELDKKFWLSYGDDISTVDLKKIENKMKKYNALIVVTACQLKSDFGIFELDGSNILNVAEKPKLPYWINGGYMLFSIEALKYLPWAKDETDLIKTVAKTTKKALVYKHQGFWKGVNTIKDIEEIREYFSKL